MVAVAASSSVACVDEARPIDDQQARLACERAIVVTAPALGCNVVRVTSTDPWGCVENDGFGNLVSRPGTWVRVQRSLDRAASLHVTAIDSGTASCDGGVGPSCGLVMRFGGVPCTCAPGTYGTYATPPAGVPLDLDLFDVETELLLQPYGATYDISVCDGPLQP